jgi:hypothetical protein
MFTAQQGGLIAAQKPGTHTRLETETLTASLEAAALPPVGTTNTPGVGGALPEKAVRSCYPRRGRAWRLCWRHRHFSKRHANSTLPIGGQLLTRQLDLSLLLAHGGLNDSELTH